MTHEPIGGKKIAIIGGGPGGLTLARLLQMKGAAVTVYERDEHAGARAQGATLDLHHESGLAALEAAGLMDDFKARYRPEAGYLRILDKDAQVRFDDSINGADGFHRPEIDRGPLNEILFQSLAPGTVVWNRQCTTLVPEKTGWRLEFRSGAFGLADIVIGADGANSKVRQFVTPLKPAYTGNMILEGMVCDSENTVPAMHGLVSGGKIFAFGDCKSLVVSSKGDGSLAFYMGCALDERWGRDGGIDLSDRLQVIGWFREEFAGWSDAWLELFEKATTPFIPRPQYCMPLGQAWETLPDITLIGDAAHVMPPSAGEGVNMAMLDALELSRCLTDGWFPDIPPALADFEGRMHARMIDVGKQTMENAAWMQGPDALAMMLDFFNRVKDHQDGPH